VERVRGDMMQSLMGDLREALHSMQKV